MVQIITDIKAKSREQMLCILLQLHLPPMSNFYLYFQYERFFVKVYIGCYA